MLPYKIRWVIKHNIFLYLISYLKKPSEWECVLYKIMEHQSSFADAHKMQIVYNGDLKCLSFQTLGKDRIDKTALYKKWLKHTIKRFRWLGYNMSNITFNEKEIRS